MQTNQAIRHIEPAHTLVPAAEPAQITETVGLKPKEYFPALDELRFFAALSVIAHHLEQFHALMGWPNHWNSFLVASLGRDGVRLFFVLSGFLISFNLLKEQQRTGRISLKNFYVRRILRIWPLYFLIVAFGFLVMPQLADHLRVYPGFHDAVMSVETNFWKKLGLYCVFLPNLANLLYPPVFGSAQCWSLGVEEQYYLLQPILFALFKPFPVAALASLVAAKYYGFHLLTDYGLHHAWTNNLTTLRNYLECLDFECFAFGGMAAFLYLKANTATKLVLNNPYARILLVATIVFCACLEFNYRAWYIAVAFALLILSMAFDSNASRNRLRRKVQYLGVISYGLYMYHPAALFFTSHLFSSISVKNLGAEFFIVSSAYCAIVLGSTIAISALSYEFFEKKFLKLKQYF